MRFPAWILLFALFSCGEAPPHEGNKPADAAAYQEITRNWDSWYRYTYREIRLALDFTGLNGEGGKVGKQAFLQALASGSYIAIKEAGGAGPRYRLYPMPEGAPDIRSTTVQMAGDALHLLGMEGKPLPPFRFTDLQGRSYDAAGTRGKVLLIKCWFINCVACVKEFPALNQLVAQHEGRDDVLFLSLATDEPSQLRSFLAKKPFRYAVVPQSEKYMTEQLSVVSYPTHLLVDRQGIIRKVTTALEDLMPSAARELKQ